MRGRGPAVVAVLLAIGVGGGFGASLLAGRQPAAEGVPSPVVARSPSYPVDPEPEYAPDPTVPALPVGLPMTTGRLGHKDFRHAFPVPAGWVPTPDDAGQTKWRNPDNPPSWTYVLRVEQVGSDNKTVARTLETRIADLDADEQDFELVDRTDDSLTYSYVTERHLRFGVLRWVSPSGSPFAEVEIAASGREIDLPGLEALVAEVAAGMKRA